LEEVTPNIDEKYMRMAMREAMNAFDADEVPIGCVIVCKGQVIARGYNPTERLHDFTAHAEMQAYTSASEFLNGKSLHDCTLYVTLEPCVMCAGALINARIHTLVFGAADLKGGATSSLYNMCADPRLNHNPAVVNGVLALESGAVLHKFFEQRRDRS
jgi:tRNA(adenine34) deaminase